ncbi:MAG: ISNCY family transposase, partial [Ignavibacteriales bacterium]|nr:ISNCY family transposase [Ignavibacteriales bacterium]
MNTILTMTQKERDRLTILNQLSERKITVAEAAQTLRISERQMYRIAKRYRSEGDQGVLHRSRGRPSHHGYPVALHTRVKDLYWQQYRDYGPTLFSEMLCAYHSIRLDHETVRRWLSQAGGMTVGRKKRPHRRQRPRRSAIGELVQFDGSPHDWFAGRAPVCCLLHAIDDASGRVFLRFVPSENTADTLRTLRHYCERFGIPRTLYTDHGTVFYAKNTLTDVGRAMTTLGVEMLFAGSPQAKGRVERGNRTHQDRLVKALSREGISTIADANRYLDEHYLDDHNRRFAQCDGLPDVHRSANGFDFPNIFCFQTERGVRNDYTIMLGGNYVQLLDDDTA